MASLNASQIPKPTDWQAFERITKDAYQIKWESPDLQMHGRMGQKQDGVDIFGDNHLCQFVGIQCKHTLAEISFSTIEEEVAKAENFHDGDLQVLYIATTAPRDAKLQLQVRQLSKKRTSSNDFALGLIYWDDVVGGLLQSAQVFDRHFPDLGSAVKSSPNETTATEALAAFNLGWYGYGFGESVNLILGEYGQMANEDPDQVVSQISIITHAVRLLFSEKISQDIVDAIQNVDHRLFKSQEDTIDGHALDIETKRVSRRVMNAMSTLKPKLARFGDVGASLAHIYHNVNNDISDIKKEELIDRVRKLELNIDQKKVRNAVNEELKYPSGYRRSLRLYGVVVDAIKWTDL